VYFGVVPLPDLLDKNKELGEALEELHEALAWTLATLVALHVAAALKHHFVDRDVVLRRMLPVLLAALLLGASAPRAVDPAQSRITATFRQMNVPVEAEFRAFRGSVDFDPARPAQAQARLEVDTASFDLGDDDYNDEARGAEWLDSKAHPRATFVSQKVAAAGADGFTAQGTFTLKGRSQPLTVPFTLRRAGGVRAYEGRFSLSRKAFGIGDADWDGVLEDAVVVTFRIVTPDA
jgi:polyisoprenoid-binding protein YceI